MSYGAGRAWPRRTLAWLFGALALATLVVGGWSAAQFRRATLGRPWFVAPSGLAIADDGTLYIGVAASEIHAYAPDGEPLRAWRVEPGGALRLRFDAGRLEVAYADADRIDVYDAQGGLVATRTDRSAYARFGAHGEREASAGEQRYALTPAGLVRVAPPPERVVVPAPPRPLALFGARPLLPITGVLLATPLCVVALLAVRPAGMR